MLKGSVGDHPQVIVGGGQAGSYAAFAMRDAGYQGRVVLVGEEDEFPYERPPLSKAHLTSADKLPPTLIYSTERYKEKKIEFLNSTRVKAISPREKKVTFTDGGTLDFDKLLLATGGRARQLSIPGSETVLYLRTIADARRLCRRLGPDVHVVCVGAGVIGLEIASSARSRGADVTVVESGARPMERTLDSTLAGWLVSLHEAAGVRFLLNCTIVAIQGSEITFAEGHRLKADVIVAGIGIQRNSELAAAAGIETDNGILVDQFGRSSIPSIFAAGDVAAFWSERQHDYVRCESWRHALDHGTIVGRNMAGSVAPYDPIPWFWTDQHGVNVQVAGTRTPSCTTVTRGCTGSGSFSIWYLDSSRRLVCVVGVNRPRDVRVAMRLIGADWIGQEGSIEDEKVPLSEVLKAAIAE